VETDVCQAASIYKGVRKQIMLSYSIRRSYTPSSLSVYKMFKLAFTIALAALFTEQALVCGRDIPVGGFCTS